MWPMCFTAAGQLNTAWTYNGKSASVEGSWCSAAVKRHHDQGHSYLKKKKKAFNWGLVYSFTDLLVHYHHGRAHGDTQDWCVHGAVAGSFMSCSVSSKREEGGNDTSIIPVPYFLHKTTPTPIRLPSDSASNKLSTQIYKICKPLGPSPFKPPPDP